MPPALWIDHLFASVPDLGVAVERLAALGLASYDASSDDRRGAVCPLGAAYLRLVEDATRPPALGWAIVADDVTAHPVTPGGSAPAEDHDEPFLAYDGLLPRLLAQPSSPPTPANFRRGGHDPIGVICVELCGDRRELETWVGRGVDELPLRISPGVPARVHEVTIATASADVRIRSTDLAPAETLSALAGGN